MSRCNKPFRDLTALTGKAALSWVAAACLCQAAFAQDKTYRESMVCRVNPAGLYKAGDPLDTSHAAQNRQAIQAAITNCPKHKRIVFLESGTYFIDGTLDWINADGRPRHWTILAGQNKDNTILKLKTGVADQVPLVMVKTQQDDEHGATAFSNGVWDLTVDVGIDNEKATGIVWCSNNWGSIRDVVVKSSDKRGDIGIYMPQAAAGPTYLKNIEVIGFKTGIKTRQNHAGIIIDGLTLTGQTDVGIKNCMNSITIRNLTSHNSVPVAQNYLCPELSIPPGGGMLTVLGGELDGGGSATSAIENDFVGALPAGAPEITRHGNLFLRNVNSSGYKSLVRGVAGTDFPQQFTFGKNLYTGASMADASPSPDPSPLNNIPGTPEFTDWNVSQWIEVGGVSTYEPNGNWELGPTADAAIRTAIGLAGSTRSTLYFPPGHYYVKDPITIPGSVKNIIGYGATLYPKEKFSSLCYGTQGFNTTANCNHGVADKPLFIIEENDASPLLIEGLDIGTAETDMAKPHMDKLIVFKHASPRTLVLRHSRIRDPSRMARVYSGESTGHLFIEGVMSSMISTWKINSQQSVWARQWNVEGDLFNEPKILNNGGKIWALGLKTENTNIVLRNTVGGQVEIYGGFMIPAETTPMPADDPIFENLGGKITAVFTHHNDNFRGRFGYLLHIRDVQGSVERVVTSKSTAYWMDLERVSFWYSAPNSPLDLGGARVIPSLPLLW